MSLEGYSRIRDRSIVCNLIKHLIINISLEILNFYNSGESNFNQLNIKIKRKNEPFPSQAVSSGWGRYH